jgi:hypothetical protein
VIGESQPDSAVDLGFVRWVGIFERLHSGLLRHGSSEPQEDLENRIVVFTIGYNKTAHPWKWRYDADADHAQYAPHPDKKTVTEAA